MSDYAYDEGYRAGMQKMREVGQRRIEELEAKLVWAMEYVADYSSNPHLVEWANANLAELKGQDDD